MPVAGPIALGANSYFGLGLFLPIHPSDDPLAPASPIISVQGPRLTWGPMTDNALVLRVAVEWGVSVSAVVGVHTIVP